MKITLRMPRAQNTRPVACLNKGDVVKVCAYGTKLSCDDTFTELTVLSNPYKIHIENAACTMLILIDSYFTRT